MHSGKLKNLIIFLIIIFCNTLIAQEANQRDRSVINWQKGYIISKGKSQITINDTGLPVDSATGRTTSLNKAREAAYFTAREMAMMSMADAIRSLRVDPHNTFSDIMKDNISTQKIISDKINNRIKSREYPAEFDSAVCELMLTFGNIISSIPYDFPSEDFPVRSENPISTSYTSLIIDSRGLDIKPMLFPVIYSENGLEIYSRNYIDSSSAIKGGMVSYCYDENHAQLDTRAGEYPYFSVAMKSLNNCPVLLEKDTRRILSSQATINNLKKCRVILIIDKS
jgi:hypothetical protein